MEGEYILVEITKRTDTRVEGRDVQSRTLLKQEIDCKSFDLPSVIEAVNFPETFKATSDLDLRRLAERCAATPRIREVDPPVEEFSLDAARERVRCLLADREMPCLSQRRAHNLAGEIIEAIFPKRD